MRTILKSRFMSERGDTIVEVMMVLAVLGLALSISYSTANRSLLNARQAHENSVATELVQNQIEGLRVLMPNATQSSPNTPITTSQFCLVLNAGTYTVTKFTPAVPPGCTLPYDPSNSSISVIYCGIVSNGACGGRTDDTFVVTASWPDIVGSSGTDTVSQVYRIHP